MIVVIDRVLGHAVGLDRVIIVKRRGLVGAVRLRALGKLLVALRGLAPHLGQHAVVARALARGHLDVVALEILHPPAHVERQVEHPLLIVALRSEFADHPRMIKA